MFLDGHCQTLSQFSQFWCVYIHSREKASVYRHIDIDMHTMSDWFYSDNSLGLPKHWIAKLCYTCNIKNNSALFWCISLYQRVMGCDPSYWESMWPLFLPCFAFQEENEHRLLPMVPSLALDQISDSANIDIAKLVAIFI